MARAQAQAQAQASWSTSSLSVTQATAERSGHIALRIFSISRDRVQHTRGAQAPAIYSFIAELHFGAGIPAGRSFMYKA